MRRICLCSFFESIGVPLSEKEVSRAIVLFELCERFSVNRGICVSLHRKEGHVRKTLVDRRRGGRRDKSLRNGSR